MSVCGARCKLCGPCRPAATKAAPKKTTELWIVWTWWQQSSFFLECKVMWNSQLVNKKNISGLIPSRKSTFQWKKGKCAKTERVVVVGTARVTTTAHIWVLTLWITSIISLYISRIATKKCKYILFEDHSKVPPLPILHNCLLFHWASSKEFEHHLVET